ncbi:hypothetical protein BGX34_007628, partial [Mortierella sp. NVP85]
SSSKRPVTEDQYLDQLLQGMEQVSQGLKRVEKLVADRFQTLETTTATQIKQLNGAMDNEFMLVRDMIHNLGADLKLGQQEVITISSSSDDE